MRIRVDLDLCQGHAVCSEEAPAVFAVDPATNRVVVLAERPDESLRADVRRAIKFCPTRALRLAED
ncbi:MAG TPA: ferredoxin [Myxococcota bacterium]|nr:ferredoxin [Myxococcota bacterium]